MIAGYTIRQDHHMLSNLYVAIAIPSGFLHKPYITITATCYIVANRWFHRR